MTNAHVVTWAELPEDGYCRPAGNARSPFGLARRRGYSGARGREEPLSSRSYAKLEAPTQAVAGSACRKSSGSVAHAYRDIAALQAQGAASRAGRIGLC
jgi:hypothetical protein